MRVVAHVVGIAALAAALMSGVVVTAGCGSSGGGATSTASASGRSEWKMVTASRVSGDQPIKMYLGSHDLGNQLRLAWVLSGPKKPPVTLTLRIINVKTGTGYGHTVTQ